MSEPRDILTTIRPADRIPSHGQQLTVDGSPGPSAERCPVCHARHPGQHCRADGTRFPWQKPETLNLWDTSPDSLPETWSTPR